MLSSPGLAVSDTAEEPSPAPAGLLSGQQKSLHAPPSVRLARQSKMVPRFMMDATLFTAVYSKTM